jgi:glutamine synthetase
LIRAALDASCEGVTAMKDPTRGGVAGALHEMAAKSGVGVVLDERQIPVRPPVRGVSELVGIDPLCVANEGKALLGVRPGAVAAVLAALRAQDVPVDQFHPEYAPGQLELSVAAADPVTAADRNVLVRQTIRAVAQAHGYQVSFAPVVVAGRVGNGGHLHFSPWSEDRDLLTDGDGPYGLTPRGESVLAGVLDRLPALCAISAPSPASYLRLVPQRWAAPWQCWGRENREAALRLVTGSVGERDRAANAELKCVDGAANPYLVAGAVIAIATAALDAGLRLPPEIPGDPAPLPAQEQPPRLPQDVPAAVAALRADDVLPRVLGPPLLEAFCAVRLAEHDLFAGDEPAAIAEATRWTY